MDFHLYQNDVNKYLEDARLALEDDANAVSCYIFGTGINIKREEIVFKLFLHNFR